LAFRKATHIIKGERSMNGKAVAVGLVLVGFFWVYLAAESYGRHKLGISLIQMAAALAFMGRGVWEWRKLQQRA
jgi:multisubunit Na+/H+ antiporter MnhC subunit